MLKAASREVTKGGVVLDLALQEYTLLKALIRDPARVFRPAELEQMLYGSVRIRDPSVLEVDVKSLRSKLGTSEIFTVRGVGYLLRKVE